MKLDKLIGERFKERPADCVIDSHALMIKGGYMKYVGNGIYSQNPVLKRITKKIENIIREEMDAIDGQEVLFPVVMPAELWEQSGRYSSIGSEMIRFEDRNKSRLVLGMTHEEAAVQLVREYAVSYTKYPFMIYQIQTKFRDEARPRGGLIRVREFTMKDAYSFHTSQEDLEVYYKKCFDAYNRIFARAGVPEVVSVAADSGMMGGSISHEYMLLTPVGEDTIAICSECDYRSNMESAENIIDNQSTMNEAEIPAAEKIATPGQHTIDEVCSFLRADIVTSCKAVVYQTNLTDEYIVVFLRGDVEVNETKLRNTAGCEIHAAEITEECGLKAGYIGFIGITDKCRVLFDCSLKGAGPLVCGANETDYHYKNAVIERDYSVEGVAGERKEIVYYDLGKIMAGGICPKCGKKAITISRGIEVGNIFQLGTKYTKAMNMQYTDSEGKLQYPIMGCYGIGVGRLAASVCEARHDEFGPIWPMSIAPWQVHICALRADDPEVRSCADKLYDDLTKDGIEVLYDDRDCRPGVMFSDADLMGVPVRVIVSPKNLKEGCIEITTRDKSIALKTELQTAEVQIKKLVIKLLNA